jgi:hypothetical protein
VILRWWGSAYATAYKVKRATASGGPYAVLATVEAQAFGAATPHTPPAFADTTYTDTGVVGGDTYRYVVSAVSPSGESADSAEAVAEVGLRERAHLAFGEGSGATAVDDTGSGWDGALESGASWASGRAGSALSLNGSGAYLSLPEGVVADLSDFTVAAWVYLDYVPAHARVFDLGTGTLHYLMLEILDGHPRFATAVVGYWGEESILGSDSLPTGEWVHIAVTLSGTVATLYVNGVEAGSNSELPLAPVHVGRTTNNWIGRSQ